MRVSACKTGKIFRKGQVVFEEGETLNGVYCVKSGVCKLTKLSENGKDQVVKLVVKGGLLGKRSLITEQKTNLSAVALNDMEMCFVPKSEIMEDLNKNPKFTMDVLKTFASFTEIEQNLLDQPEDLLLLKSMAAFPGLIEAAALDLAPHRVIFYLIELAGQFHSYYNKHKVISEDIPLSQARLALVDALRIVLANGLQFVGLSAPEKM